MSEQTEIRFKPLNDGSEEDCQCARCGSSADYVDCYNCYDGYSYHDCGEDSCCCRYPEPNVPCDVCRGAGGWYRCLSSAEWCLAHPIPGRESIERGRIEWFTIPPRATPDKPSGESSSARSATP